MYVIINSVAMIRVRRLHRQVAKAATTNNSVANVKGSITNIRQGLLQPSAVLQTSKVLYIDRDVCQKQPQPPLVAQTAKRVRSIVTCFYSDVCLYSYLCL